MLEGTIIKGIGGFYYVRTKDKTYECRARGLFREEGIKPLVGDKVAIRVSKEDGSGYVEEIFPRKNQLLRPAVANVDQVMIVMSLKSPNINLWLLDRFLIMAEKENLDIKIVLSKVDLISLEDLNRVKEIYEKAGYELIALSNDTGQGLDKVKSLIESKTTVLAGPSGVGKSTLLNSLDSDLDLETGVISHKTSRGKHTTRHVELLYLGGETFVLDTPGFSSLDLSFIDKEEDLSHYFKEFIKEDDPCKFTGCLHHKEPGCSVKRRVDKEEIAMERYENYLRILDEFKNIRRY